MHGFVLDKLLRSFNHATHDNRLIQTIVTSPYFTTDLQFYGSTCARSFPVPSSQLNQHGDDTAPSTLTFTRPKLTPKTRTDNSRPRTRQQRIYLTYNCQIIHCAARQRSVLLLELARLTLDKQRHCKGTRDTRAV